MHFTSEFFNTIGAQADTLPICASLKQAGTGAGPCPPEALLFSNSGLRRPFLNPSGPAAICTAMNLMDISSSQQGRNNAAMLVCAVGLRVG